VLEKCYVAGCSGTMELRLRRTFVLLVIFWTIFLANFNKMRKKMDKLESAYFLTTEIFEKNILKITKDTSMSLYRESHKALFFCQKKIDALLNSIEVLNVQNREDYYYSIQVSTRVLFEHFIIGHYIWTKTRIEKNDNCGVEYYAHYRLSELLRRENYELGIEGIEKNIKNNTTFENLQKGLKIMNNRFLKTTLRKHIE
jgi:hypothetical protein